MFGRHTISLEVTSFRLSFAKNIFLDLEKVREIRGISGLVEI